jgi:hypothetical protein
MKKLAFGALCIGLLSMAACGGGGDRVDTIITHVDGGGDGSSLVCNVATNTGCAQGEKCTWVRVSVGENETMQLGQVGCVADGTVPTGGACTYGMSGVLTGFDDCVGGNICLAPRTAENATGTCKEICSLADASNPCAEDFACGAYQKYFSNNSDDTPLAGVCDPTCNPLTNTRDSDDAPACGDATPTDQTDAGSVSCYGLPSRNTNPTTFRCSGIIDEDANTPGIQNDNTHRVQPSRLCLNCCAPGNAPLYYESDAVQEVVCFAYCQPQISNNTLPEINANGLSPFACADTTATGPNEECRYLWFFEQAFTTAEVPLSANSDAYGFCWDYTQYGYDHDEDTGTADIPWPSCTTVAPDTAGPGGDYFWGCTSSDNAPAFAPTVKPAFKLLWSLDETRANARQYFEQQ